jgi:hypothetical protein
MFILDKFSAVTLSDICYKGKCSCKMLSVTFIDICYKRTYLRMLYFLATAVTSEPVTQNIYCKSSELCNKLTISYKILIVAISDTIRDLRIQAIHNNWNKGMDLF